MDFEALVKHISTIQSTLQAQAAHAVNLALTARKRRTTVEETGTAVECQRTERAQVS